MSFLIKGSTQFKLMANHLILEPKIVSSNAWQSSDSLLMFLLYCAETITWDLHSKIFECRTQRCWVQAQGCKQISKTNRFSLTETFWLTLVVISYVPFSALDATVASLGSLTDETEFLVCMASNSVFWVLHSAHHNSPLLSRVIKILLRDLWHIFFWLLLL